MRYIKLSANFDINNFEQSESKLNTDNNSYDNNSDNSVYNELHESHEIFKDCSLSSIGIISRRNYYKFNS